MTEGDVICHTERDALRANTCSARTRLAGFLKRPGSGGMIVSWLGGELWGIV